MLLLQKFNEGGLLQRLLLRYSQALITEAALNVVCSRHHKVEQRLCRWLLSMLDRLPLVAFTAFDRPEDRERTTNAGFQRHLSKPASFEVLIETIVGIIKPN